MWGAFLSEPLRIVGLVGRYPANCLMRRMPISVRCYPFLPRGCPRGMYAGLARLSAGYPPDRGRLHTCYSPVRRSPAGGASSSPAAARLACVKPAASVHPEPGSNSSLLVIYCYISFQFVFFPADLRSESFRRGNLVSSFFQEEGPVFPCLYSFNSTSFYIKKEAFAAFLSCGNLVIVLCFRTFPLLSGGRP